MKKNEILDHLVGISKKAQLADARRLRADHGRLSLILDEAQEILSHFQSDSTLHAIEPRLESLLSRVRSQLSTTKTVRTA
jgi:hypothetical protein